jgi:MFS family permease
MIGQFRQALRAEPAAVCLVVFLCDAANGFVFPTFSLFAQQLGISLALLGFINMLGGLTQLGSAIPLGAFSDRASRPRMIQAGAAAFGLALATLALADGAVLLIAARVLLALGMVLVFRIGAAHLGDVTPVERRSLAFGAYATALGLGFTTGSLLGGQLNDALGARGAYLAASTLTLAAVLLAWRRLHSPARSQATAAPGAFLDGLRVVARHRGLLLINLGGLLMSVTFGGAIATFFPLYATELLVSQATISTMFAVRGLVSTAGRIPNSIVARMLGNQAVMLSAVLVELLVMFAIWSTRDVGLLTLILAVEGLAFGAYMVSSQTYLVEQTTPDVRGAAIGVNTTASGLGSTLAPLALGLIAAQWGVAVVFPVTGAFLVIGFITLAAGMLALRRAKSVQTEFAR